MNSLTRTLCCSLSALATLAPLRSLVGQSCEPFWHEIPGIGVDSVVHALTVWDPDGAGARQPLLVVGGQFTEVGGMPAPNIATWDPVTGEWGGLGSGMNAEVRTLLTLPNGDLVAGGSFTTAGGEAATKLARWDGERWHAMGSLPDGVAIWEHPSPGVYALTTSPAGDLIAGGNFFLRAGDWTHRHLATWNGERWLPLIDPTDQQLDFMGVVYSLKFLNGGDLIVGGYFEYAGPIPAVNIARWDGAGWNPMGEGLYSGRFGIGGVSVLREGPGGDLLAGGIFQHPGGGDPIDAIARWDGAAWHKLGEGLDNWTLISVEAMLPQSGGSVIVGGWFDTAGGKPALGVARWDGEEWSALPGAHAIAHALAALPSGDIAVGGQIGTSGAHLAIWGCRQCYADCDGDGSLDFFDFLCFQNLFAAGDPTADCDGDGELDFFDFLCFQNAFAAGCP